MDDDEYADTATSPETPHPSDSVFIRCSNLRMGRKLVFPKAKVTEKKNKGSSKVLKKSGSRVSRKNAERFILQKRFKNGDIVWAKAFPYTWWPGWIEKTKGFAAFVRFYGCDKTRSIKVSEIREFEESYAQMTKMVGVKLAFNIKLALEELRRRVGFGLMCPCQDSVLEASGLNIAQIGKEKKGFEPAQALGFVLHVAVSAWVGEEETVRAARILEQVLAYRKHVSICQNSVVDNAFCPCDLVDFVRKKAVSWCGDDCEIVGDSKLVAQLNGYQRFVSVCPNWSYQQTLELHDSLISEESEGEDESEGTYKEMSPLSSDSENIAGIQREREDVNLLNQVEDSELTAQRETEDVILSYQLEEDCEVTKEEVTGCKEICTVNRADYSLLDQDQEYEMLLDVQLETLTCNSRSTCLDIYTIGNLDTTKSSAGCLGNDVDIPTKCNKSIPSVSDVDRTIDGDTWLSNKEELISVSSSDANNLHENTIDFLSAHNIGKPPENVACQATSSTISEKEKVKSADDIDNDFVHGEKNCASEALSSVGSSFLEAAPLADRQLVAYQTKSFGTLFPDEKLKFSSSYKVDLVVKTNDGFIKTVNIASTLASLKETVWGGFKKRKLDHAFTHENHFGQNSSLDLLATAAVKTMNTRKCQRFAPHSVDMVLTADFAIVKPLLLPGPNESLTSVNNSMFSDKTNGDGDSLKPSCSSSLSKHVSGINFPHERGPREHVEMIIAKQASSSPRYFSKSGNKPEKSTATDRNSNFPRSLHMKFPRDFTLPSKEELEKKFRVFGRLDYSRTQISLFTGAAKVVFLNPLHAYSALRYVKTKNVFGQANVRFWFDAYENSSKGQKDHDLSVHTERSSSLHRKSDLQRSDLLHKRDKLKGCRIFSSASLNLKPCLRSPNAPKERDTKRKVRFTIES